MKIKGTFFILFVLLALAGCDRDDPMVGRWLFRHELFRCYTVVEVTSDGTYTETLKLSTRKPLVKKYKIVRTGQGMMELVNDNETHRVKYSVIGNTMRVKEVGSANDGTYVRMKPKDIVPWEDMSKPENRPGATSADRVIQEGRIGGNRGDQ